VAVWKSAVFIALALVAGGAIYIRLRWHRSPQAYRAMIVIAACYFSSGLLMGAWVFRLATPKANIRVAEVATPTPSVRIVSPGASVTPGNPYDPTHAALPDPKMTPGDTFSGATADDVCTPGWATEHRHVTDSERAQVYAEYGRTWGCCEVDHLVPLELGGSNEIKNLWPQPYGPPLPDANAKDQLENELHARVCKGKMLLADAQKCIASDWVKCWEMYAPEMYGQEWASTYRHGW
jgi:hypothetical protein